MERFWTVKDVMEVIPLGKTSCVAIINSLPHINLGGKLMVDPQYIREWIARNTKPGKTSSPAPVVKKPKPRRITGLPNDGLIPYRRSKKGA